MGHTCLLRVSILICQIVSLQAEHELPGFFVHSLAFRGISDRERNVLDEANKIWTSRELCNDIPETRQEKGIQLQR